MDIRLRQTYKYADGSTTQHFFYPGVYTTLLDSTKKEAERDENIVVAQVWMEIAIRESMDQEEKRWDESVKVYERAYPFRIGREA